MYVAGDCIMTDECRVPVPVVTFLGMVRDLMVKLILPLSTLPISLFNPARTPQPQPLVTKVIEMKQISISPTSNSSPINGALIGANRPTHWYLPISTSTF